MFEWTKDTVRFRLDASEYTQLDEALAERIALLIPKRAHVLDAGCGLGLTALALASRGFRVTAVDSSPVAIDCLKTMVSKRGITNVVPACADAFALEREAKFDAAVFCMFGKTDETLALVKRVCRGKAVIIKKNRDTHRFCMEERRLGRHTFNACAQRLAGLKVPFEAETFTLEMGQPFRAVEDAELFFSIYDKAAGGTGDVGRDGIMPRLIETGRRDYQYFFPSPTDVGIITLNAGDIPEGITFAEERE